MLLQDGGRDGVVLLLPLAVLAGHRQLLPQRRDPAAALLDEGLCGAAGSQ